MNMRENKANEPNEMQQIAANNIFLNNNFFLNFLFIYLIQEDFSIGLFFVAAPSDGRVNERRWV